MGEYEGFCQGAFHALRAEELRHGVSFLVSVAVWIQPKVYTLAYWCNKIQILTHSYFHLSVQFSFILNFLYIQIIQNINK